MNLPANSDQTIEIRALPTQGSGVVSVLDSSGLRILRIKARRSCWRQLSPASLWPMLSTTIAMASMTLSWRIRISAVSSARNAGGRSFALVLKDSNHNAFNSVGGMRDTFAKRVEPTELQGLNEYTRMNWMGLTNRPYSFQIDLQR